jgi:hypothetical protein
MQAIASCLIDLAMADRTQFYSATTHALDKIARIGFFARRGV